MEESFLAAGIFALDYFIKKQVEKNPEKFRDRRTAGGKIRLHLLYNSGIAGGYLDKSTQRIADFSLLCMLCLLLLQTGKNAGSDNPCRRLSLAMLLGGGLENWYERQTKGKVTDYIGFPCLPGKAKDLVFNLSDFSIFLGSFLFVTSVFAEKETN